jgi:hypothetical protein
MLLVALGVMFDLLPGWARNISGSAGRTLATLNKILPILPSIVGFTFIFSIFRRFAKKGGLHLLMWGIGLVFFATGSFTEALHGQFGWHNPIFRFWYLFGAVLIAAWMGQGTMHLLAKKRTAMIFLVILVFGSIYATVKVMSAHLEPILLASGVETVEVASGFESDEVLRLTAGLMHETALDETGQINRRKLTPLTRAVAETAVDSGASIPEAVVLDSQDVANLRGTVEGHTVVAGHAAWLQDQDIDPSVLVAGAPGDANWELYVGIDGQPAARIDLQPPIVFSGHVITTPGVRSLTPFFNTFGIILLIGGAIYSAWIFWRKGIMANRAIGNLLIAGGAILGGGASAFARFGMLTYLYVAELASLILVFWGLSWPSARAPGPIRAQTRNQTD